MEHTVKLTAGVIDKEGKAHTEVTFGRRLLGRDLFEISREAGGVEYDLMVYRAAITKFGDLPLPLRRHGMNVFLSLDIIDREILEEGYNRFMLDSLEGRAEEVIDSSSVRLPIGYRHNDLLYNTVTFGRLTTGWDEVAAERSGEGVAGRNCILMGREITRFATQDGAHTLETPISMSVFEEMDTADIIVLKQASDDWQEHIRASRAAEILRENLEPAESVN